MNEEEKFSWSALEYEEKERSTDWFWALGVIVVTGAITAIIYNNYFFSTLLILGGILLGVFAKKKPAIITYELNDRGLKVGSYFYPYENIKAFFVQEHNNDKKHKPTLFIRSERVFMPIISIPIENEWIENIQNLMLEKNIKEEEMREHISDKIMDYFGF
ncbi:MAG: hypothetical protein WC783_01470 [Candidatus Paceibacterota bacterium]|jgi:hypothetical protein